MVLNGRPVNEVAQCLGIGENLIYRWKSRSNKQQSTASTGNIVAVAKLLQSMSRADNPYDNAFMESCFSRFKAELLHGGAFQNKEDAQTEIFEFIDMYYNNKPRHSSLNYESTMTFENNYDFYQTEAILLSGIFDTPYTTT